MHRKGFSPVIVAFTKGSTSNGDRRFFPLGTIFRTAEVKFVLGIIDIYALTGDTLFQMAFQQSDSTETWPDAATFTQIGTSSATAGPVFSNNGFEDISSGLNYAIPFVRFGALLRNNNGNPARIECCWLSGRYDIRGC